MQFQANVIFNQALSPGYWRMRLSAPESFAASRAGQFVMVRVGQGCDPLLRRPLGIFDLGKNADGTVYFDLLYHVVGKGTAMLAALRAEATLDVLGPLGTGFALGDTDEEKLIVGGGIGLAPLYILAKEFVAQAAAQAKNPTLHLFAGGRTADDVPCMDEFSKIGVHCHIATENGALGEKGRVTLPLIRHLDGLLSKTTKAAIYTCGPEGMLKAVAALAHERDIACQVSLEGYMACGVGACLGCVTPGKNHSAKTPDYRCVCTEGPVFDSRQLQWEGA